VLPVAVVLICSIQEILLEMSHCHGVSLGLLDLSCQRVCTGLELVVRENLVHLKLLVPAGHQMAKYHSRALPGVD
jgi:hypothetical protein